MKFDLVSYALFGLSWAIIAAILAYFISRKVVENPFAVAALNFFLGFIPPVSWISLVLLALKVKKS